MGDLQMNKNRDKAAQNRHANTKTHQSFRIDLTIWSTPAHLTTNPILFSRNLLNFTNIQFSRLGFTKWNNLRIILMHIKPVDPRLFNTTIQFSVYRLRSLGGRNGTRAWLIVVGISHSYAGEDTTYHRPNIRRNFVHRRIFVDIFTK